MAQNQQITDTKTATAIARSGLNPNLSIIETVPLHGGMVNQVEKWLTDGEPSAIVAKVNSQPDHKEFKDEFGSLNWYRENSSLPVPKPYACASGIDDFSGTCLLMEAIGGVNLGQARLSTRGTTHFQTQLALTLSELHNITRNTYGSALEAAGSARWLDIFTPQIEKHYSKSKDQLNRSSRKTIEKILAELNKWLPEFNRPTLIHGDIWAANIMADDTDPDKPLINAFLDVNAQFADVEYELAYLSIFNTADETFLSEYTKHHPLRPDSDRRYLVYWLNTMMIHVWYFGPSYVPPCQDIVRQIEAIS